MAFKFTHTIEGKDHEIEVPEHIHNAIASAARKEAEAKATEAVNKLKSVENQITDLTKAHEATKAEVLSHATKAKVYEICGGKLPPKTLARIARATLPEDLDSDDKVSKFVKDLKEEFPMVFKDETSTKPTEEQNQNQNQNQNGNQNSNGDNRGWRNINTGGGTGGSADGGSGIKSQADLKGKSSQEINAFFNSQLGLDKK